MTMTNPSSASVASTDNPRTLTVDYAALGYLNVGETVTAIVTILTDTSMTQGTTVTLSDAPTVIGPADTSVAQKIRGSELQIKHQYLLKWVATLSSGDVLTVATTIYVPY